MILSFPQINPQNIFSLLLFISVYFLIRVSFSFLFIYLFVLSLFPFISHIQWPSSSFAARIRWYSICTPWSRRCAEIRMICSDGELGRCWVPLVAHMAAFPSTSRFGLWPGFQDNHGFLQSSFTTGKPFVSSLPFDAKRLSVIPARRKKKKKRGNS